MDAFLLGAGFSHAVSDAMPVTRELGGQIAKQLTGRGYDTSALRELYGGDFEAWLTQLVEGRPWTTEAEHARDRGLFLDATSLIGQNIRLALRKAARPPWLERLVTYWHQNRSVVLSLNYDTIVEEAVQKASLKHDGTLIHYSDIYAVPITSAKLRRAGIFGNDYVQTFRLLKLHGSINWWYSGSDAARGETLYDGGLTHGWDSEFTEVVGDRDLNLLADKVPYVVPPTGTKSSFFTNETITAQWSVAHRFLRGCQLVVMGYSLPEGDHLMRRFLHEAPLMTAEVSLIDCDERIAERYERLLPGFSFSANWSGSVDAVERFANQLPISPEG
jgi:hypothetical protein